MRAFGVVFILVTFATLIFCAHAQRTAATDFYASALEEAGYTIPSRAFDDLRLEYARMLAERAPLLSLAGADIDGMRENIAALNDAQAQLIDAQTSARDRADITRLYPLAFLRALTTAEARRREFVADPTWQAAAAYRRAQRITAHALSDDLDQYEVAYARVIADNFSYQTPEGIVSKESTLALVHAMQARVRILQREISDEDLCIAERSVRCDMSRSIRVSLSADESAKANVPASALTARRELAQVHGVPSLAAAPLYHIGSKCGANLAAGEYALVQDLTAVGGMPEIAVYAGDITLLSITALAAQPKAVMLQYFQRHGMTYASFHPFEFYTCPDSWHDQHTAFATMRTYVLAANYVDVPLSSPTVSSAREESAARAFVDAALQVHPLDADIRQLDLMWRDGSANFQDLLGQIAFVETHEVRQKMAGVPVDLSPQRLFSTQSGFPLLYGVSDTISMGELPSIAAGGMQKGLANIIKYWSQLPAAAQAKAIKDLTAEDAFHWSPETFSGEGGGTSR